MVAVSGGAAEPGVPLVAAEPALREVTLTGFTRARAELPLATETAGRVVAVAYDIGETIGQDGIFARLDDTFIKLELAEVEVQQERLRTRIVPFALTPDQYKTLVDSDNDGLRLHLPDLKREVAASIYRTYPGFGPVTRKIAVDLALRSESYCSGAIRGPTASVCAWPHRTWLRVSAFGSCVRTRGRSQLSQIIADARYSIAI